MATLIYLNGYIEINCGSSKLSVHLGNALLATVSGKKNLQNVNE